MEKNLEIFHSSLTPYYADLNNPPLTTSLEANIEKVYELAHKCQSQNKKLCIFLARGAEQTVPQEPDEMWVSLDITNASPLDSNRIHLQMNLNDGKNWGVICGLFDKVIMDLSAMDILKFPPSPWLKCSELLKNDPKAQLIAETSMPHALSPVPYISEDKPLYSAIAYNINGMKGDVQYPLVLGINQAKQEQLKQNAIMKTTDESQKYLQKFFDSVVLKLQQPFPCQNGLHDYFILTGPKFK